MLLSSTVNPKLFLYLLFLADGKAYTKLFLPKIVCLHSSPEGSGARKNGWLENQTGRKARDKVWTFLLFYVHILKFSIILEKCWTSQTLICRVVELTGDTTPDMRAVANADVIVTTPEKWDGISRSWQTRNYVKAVALLVIDEIHLLGMNHNWRNHLCFPLHTILWQPQCRVFLRLCNGLPKEPNCHILFMSVST